jgi:hypothetical protein
MTESGQLERVFPWGVEAGVRTVVLTAGCGLGLGAAWWEVAGQGVFSRQIGWLTAGVMLLMVSLYALTSLVVRGRRAIGVRRSELLNDGILGVLATLSISAPTLVRVEPDRTDVLVAKGLGLFHRPECPMVASREIERMSRLDAETDGLARCGICFRQLASNGARETVG